MSCCIYHPNVYFNDAKYSNYPVLSEISMKSSNAMCNVCRSTIGACIKCTWSKSSCNKWFHITCMQQKQLYLHFKNDYKKNEQPLTAYCQEHTNQFRSNHKQTAQIRKPSNNNNNGRKIRGRYSGRKRTARQRDEEYIPSKPNTNTNNKSKQNRSNGRPKSRSKRKPKDKPDTSSSTKRIKIPLPEFSPEPSKHRLNELEQRTDEYINNLLLGNKINSYRGDNDDISSVSSQEIDKEPVIREPPKKKRRKSAVDLLSHSSFALKRNKWVFNQTFHLFPNRLEFYESKDYEIDEDDVEDQNPNHWTMETTTDPTQIQAEQCMRSVETLWTHRQTNLLAKSQNSRDYRKAVGFSILKNPNGDVITSCNWSFWEVSATKKAVLIKLFITEPYSKSHIPQRRKKNGTLLAAHVMDISFRLRDDVDWVVICSERGIAEIFWRALGFTDFKIQEKRGFCRGTEKDLNQFRDTILLRMHHDDYVKKYCDDTQDWDDDNCAVQKVFRKWRKKHLFMNRNIIFKHKGNTIHQQKISSY